MTNTVKKPDARNSQLAQIHIAKKNLGLDDETYRDMLFTIEHQRARLPTRWSVPIIPN